MRCSGGRAAAERGGRWESCTRLAECVPVWYAAHSDAGRYSGREGGRGVVFSDLEVKEQRARLERARRDRALIEAIPRVVAAGFGVIPIGRIEGGLEVACAPTCTEAALAALERATGLRIRALPMHEGLVHVFISRLYLEGAAVDFNTFERPDFLDDPRSDRKLLSEKDDGGLTVQWRPLEDEIVVLDYAYRTELLSEDHPPQEPSFEAGPLEVGFEIVEEGGAPLVLLEAETPPGPDVGVIARESYRIGGMEHRHGWRSHWIEGAPFMIHPSEVQIIGLGPHGVLRLWVYDRAVEVRPGETPRFELTYWFLSMGQRLRRHLEVRIHRLEVVPRRRLRAVGEPLPWRPEHLRRWIGLEQEAPCRPAGRSGGGKGAAAP